MPNFTIMCRRALVGATTAVLTLSAPAFHARAQAVKPIELTPFVLDGPFVGDEPSAKDLSGIACLAPDSGKRVCLAVNDNNKNAQFVTLNGQNAVVGDPIALIGDAPDKATLGKAPEIVCPKGPGDFDELDGEGVAFSAPYFYVVGSHGCARKKNKFRLSSFILSRIHVDTAGRPAAAATPAPADATVLNTYRVSDLLQRLGKVSESIGKGLETDSGLNIEGIAADGDRIWFGLRAPLDEQGNAVLVEASAADLFKDGNEPSVLEPKVTPLKLDKLGIRDLALMPDKKGLLVLAGATHGAEVPFHVFSFDFSSGKPSDLGALPLVQGTVDGKLVTGKAEAITVLEADPEKIIAAVLFDSLPNGAPQMATISLK
jgi:hypothetical protein